MTISAVRATAIISLSALMILCGDKSTGGDDTPVLYPWDFLPTDNQVDGWVREDTTNYRIWHDDEHPDSYLSDFINGGDSQYLPYGFVRGTRMKYVKSDSSATMLIYEFVNADSAMQLYSAIGQAYGTDPVPGLADSARIRTGLFDAILDCVRERYYMEVAVIPKTETADAESLAALAVRSIDAYTE